MEDARIRTQRNIPITIGLFLLAIGLFCTLFFLPLQFPTSLYVGLGWCVLFVVCSLATYEPGQGLRKRVWSVALLISATGWFAYLGTDYPSGSKGSIYFAVAGICCALLAAWEASGLIKVKKQSA